MSPELAVRNYLQFLKDPSALRDEQRIAALKAAVSEAADPLDELKRRSELAKAEQLDGSQYRDAFVDHAKAYASDNNIAVEAFRAMGVADSDLRAAGLLSASKRQSGIRTRVSMDTIRSAVSSEPFTSKDLEARTGAAYVTIRKAINDMVAEGVIVEIGPVPNYQERGRVPMLYRTA